MSCQSSRVAVLAAFLVDLWKSNAGRTPGCAAWCVNRFRCRPFRPVVFRRLPGVFLRTSDFWQVILPSFLNGCLFSKSCRIYWQDDFSFCNIVFVPGGFLSQVEMLKQLFQYCNLNSERPFDPAGTDSRQKLRIPPDASVSYPDRYQRGKLEMRLPRFFTCQST